MGNKTAYKEERQTEKKKKNEQERKIKIDKKKGSPNFGLCPLTKNKKGV